RDLCVKAARRAGLSLDDLMLAQLLEGAPYALGMAPRRRPAHDPQCYTTLFRSRDLCVKAARRAGLSLDDLMLAQLLEGAPYALGMARRLRRDHDLHHEPANIFSFPVGLDRAGVSG